MKTPLIFDSLSNTTSYVFFLKYSFRFHAPWCKTCQRLGLKFKRLATEFGDVIADSQKVSGDVRFAEVTYGPETSYFIMDQLQVEGVPTLQLYHGLNKIWQGSGGGRIEKDLRNNVESLLQLQSTNDMTSFAQEMDDGILQAAIEECFYDYPSFLDEEW